MMDRMLLYGHNPSQGSSDAKKKQNIKRRSLRQKSRRADVVNKHRDLTPVNEKKQQHGRRDDGIKLKERMREWKKQRDQKKYREKSTKKPVFKVTTNIEREDHMLFATDQAVTKRDSGLARSTRSKSKNKHGSTNTEDLISRRKQTKHERHSRPRDKKCSSKNEAGRKCSSVGYCKRKSFAPDNFTFKPPVGLPALGFDESLSDSMTSAIFNQDLTAINLPKPNKSATISSEEKTIQLPPKTRSSGKDLEKFQQLYKTATRDLQEQCKRWKHNLATGVLEDAQSEIQSVTDQAAKLLKDQLKKYDDLLCKSSSSKYKQDKNIFKDLEKSWSLLSSEVEVLLDKFKRLDKAKIEKSSTDCSKKDTTRIRKGKMPASTPSKCRRSGRLKCKEIGTVTSDERNESNQVQVTPERLEEDADTILSETNINVLQSQRLGGGSERRCRSAKRMPKLQDTPCSTTMMRGKLEFAEEGDDKENEEGAIAAKYLMSFEQATHCANDCLEDRLDAKYLMMEGTPISSNTRSAATKSKLYGSGSGNLRRVGRRTKDNGLGDRQELIGDLITFSPA